MGAFSSLCPIGDLACRNPAPGISGSEITEASAPGKPEEDCFGRIASRAFEHELPSSVKYVLSSTATDAATGTSMSAATVFCSTSSNCSGYKMLITHLRSTINSLGETALEHLCTWHLSSQSAPLVNRLGSTSYASTVLGKPAMHAWSQRPLSVSTASQRI